MDQVKALQRRPIQAACYRRHQAPPRKAQRVTILSMGCGRGRGIFLPPVTSAMLLGTAAVTRPRRSCLRNVVLGVPLGTLMSVTGLQPAVAAPLFPGPQFEVGLSPRSVASGDFNQDGLDDLAVANAAPEVLSILLGT